MTSAKRKFSYDFLGTLSSGYDSTTNTVLAQQGGLRDVISFLNARGGAADDGKDIADKLGIKLTLIPRNNWQSLKFGEVHLSHLMQREKMCITVQQETCLMAEFC